MIDPSRVAPTYGPKSMRGAKMYAAFMREAYEALLDERLPERLGRLVERLDPWGSSVLSPGEAVPLRV